MFELTKMPREIRIYFGKELVFRCEDCKFDVLDDLFSEVEASLDIKRGDYRLYWGRTELVNPNALIDNYWGSASTILTIKPHATWSSLWNSFLNLFSQSRYRPVGIDV